MQAVAKFPQKLLSFVDHGFFGGLEETQFGQITERFCAKVPFCDPGNSLNVPEPTGRVLNIWLQRIINIVVLSMATFLLFNFGFQESLGGPYFACSGRLRH